MSIYCRLPAPTCCRHRDSPIMTFLDVLRMKLVSFSGAILWARWSQNGMPYPASIGNMKSDAAHRVYDYGQFTKQGTTAVGQQPHGRPVGGWVGGGWRVVCVCRGGGGGRQVAASLAIPATNSDGKLVGFDGDTLGWPV